MRACSGRLTVAERRASLLDRAEAVFLDRGFRTATMNEIACQAGISKKTIYQLFPSKASLIEALLADRFRSGSIAMADDGRPVREVLVDALCRAVEHVLTDRQLALLRLMVTEGALIPWERSSVAGQSSAALVRWLEASAAKGALPVEDPVEAASWLFWSAASRFVIQALLNKGAAPTRKAIETQVRRTVDSFLLDAETV